MTRRALFKALAALALIASLVPACSRERADPAPSGARLAVLSPALAMTLAELGLGHLIVARHAYDASTGAGVPIAGDESGVEVETLARARPTHVLVESTSAGTIEHLRSLRARFGWEVEVFELRTIEDIAASARSLTALLAPDDQRALARIDDFERALASRHDPAYRGRVLMLASESPPGAIGPDSFHGEILERLGIPGAITQGSAWVELDGEDLLRLDPDAIVLIHPRLRDGSGDLRQRLVPLDGLDLRAVREGRVALIDDPGALMPSLRLDVFARELLDAMAGFGG